MKTLNGYSKETYTNDYMLLAGYGTKSISDFVLIASSNRLGVTKLFRRDDNSNYSVQTDWTGTYWRLRGYSADTYHAGCLVAYADSTGIATSLKYIGGVSSLDSGCTSNGIYAHANTATSSPSNAYGNLLNISNKDTCSPGTDGHWIQLLDFTHESSIWHRQRINTGSWTAWEKILTTANWTGIIDGRYLLLSGGTMTGALTVPSISVTGAATFSLAINGSILGNAATASRLQNARTITIGSKSNNFDGTSDISFTLALIGAQPAGNYKTVQTAVSTIGASTNTLTFINSISQDTNGVISATTGVVRDASTSVAGVVSTTDQSFVGTKTFTGDNWATQVIIKRNNGNDSVIRYDNSTGLLGYIGVGSGKFPYWATDSSHIYTLYHTGNLSALTTSNYTSYAVSLTGALTISGNKTFSSSVSIDDLTAGNLVVTGGASFAQTISGTASAVTVNTPLTTDDSLYNIVFHSGNNLYTSPAKVGRVTGRITCGDVSCGALTASSTISLANNTSLGFKDTTDTYRSCLTLNTSNSFTIGYGTSGAGYNSYYDGKYIYFRTNTNHTTALTLSSSQIATFAGKVELKADQYTDDGTTCGLDAKNSNIVGINALYFADYCNSATEGINFKRSSGSNVDTLYCQDGKLFFMPNRSLGTSTATAIQLNAISDNGKPLNQFLPRATPGNIVEQTADSTYTGIIPAYLFSFMLGKPVFDINNFPEYVKLYNVVDHGTGSYQSKIYTFNRNGLTYGNLSKYRNVRAHATYDEIGAPGTRLDGFHVAHSTEKGHTYVCIFCAMIDPATSFTSPLFIAKNYILNWRSNALGDGWNSFWITDNHLSNKWQWYGYVVNCGWSGTFSTTNHFDISPETALTIDQYTWVYYSLQICYAQVFDITDFNYFGTSRVMLADKATIADEYKEEITNFTGSGQKSVTSFGTVIGKPGSGEYMQLKVNIAATDADIGRILTVRKPLNAGYVRIYWINTSNTFVYESGVNNQAYTDTYEQVPDGGYLRFMYLGMNTSFTPNGQQWIKI